MSLLKDTNTGNVSSLHKVQIIKDIYITDVPDAISIYLSEMSFAGGNRFQDIEITDGSFSIDDKDDGHGTYYEVKVDFRHPKVREAAETVLQTYRGKMVRMVLTDKNGMKRLTPAGKLSITESIPDMPNYNGYLFKLKTEGEQVPYITMDTYPEPPAPVFDWETFYNNNYQQSILLATVNSSFTLALRLNNWDVKQYITLEFNGEKEVITLPQYTNFIQINRTYTVTQPGYFQIWQGRFNNGIFEQNRVQFTISSRFVLTNAGIDHIFITREPANWDGNAWLGNPSYLDLSGNNLSVPDVNEILSRYQWVIDTPSWWDGDEFFYINGGTNAVPTDVDALAIAAKMNQLVPNSYRDNS